jgi:indolepyruvate ferredoxin oxidoreductase beta subunit
MSSQHDPLNLIVSGVGGQGNILISRMIGRILTKSRYLVTIGETFGAAQRGGPVFSSMRISKKKYYGPLIPEGKGHVILSLEPLEALRTLNLFGNPNLLILTNTQPIYPVGVLSKRVDYPDLAKLKESIRKLSSSSWFLNATEMALELESPIVANIIMLGALAESNAVPIRVEDCETEIANSFPSHKVDLNLLALNRGVNAIRHYLI